MMRVPTHLQLRTDIRRILRRGHGLLLEALEGWPAYNVCVRSDLVLYPP